MSYEAVKIRLTTRPEVHGYSLGVVGSFEYACSEARSIYCRCVVGLSARQAWDWLCPASMVTDSDLLQRLNSVPPLEFNG